MEYRVISEKTDTLAKWVAIALGFSIPISTALDGLLLAAIIALWVLGAGYRRKWELIRNNPVALLCLALFGLLVLGVVYGDAPAREGLRFLGKYKELLLVALLIPLFQDANIRRNALTGFGAAMVLTLALSYLIGFDLLPQNNLLHGDQNNPVVFKLHITHNLLVAFSAFLFASAARHESAPRKRIFLGILACLAIYNVLFMVQGKTGQVVLAILLVYYFFLWLGLRGLVVGIMASVVLTGAAFYGSKTFHDRATLAATEFSEWRPDRASDTGVGLRMEFYRNSLAIVRDHPVFGVGTGGFPNAYAEKVKGTGMAATVNPHNEYLLIATQLGLPGLGLLFYLFYRQWRLAVELATPLETNLACGLLLTIAIGSLFNSLLIDHTEGLFYAWMSALLFAGLKPAPTPSLPRSRGEGENFVPSPAARARAREGAK